MIPRFLPVIGDKVDLIFGLLAGSAPAAGGGVASARYARRLIAMREGTVVAQDTPAEVLTEGMLEEVFGHPARRRSGKRVRLEPSGAT